MSVYHVCKNSQQRPGRREECLKCNPARQTENQIIMRQNAHIRELEAALSAVTMVLSVMIVEFADAAETQDQLDAVKNARAIRDLQS